AAIAESGLNLDFYVYRLRKQDEVLPWEHLDFGVSKGDLYADYIKGLNEKASGSPELFDKSQCLLPENYVEPKNDVLPPVMRLRLCFSRKGALRFVSHLEQIEVFRRAARRSGLPVAYTAGFSPQVKSSYGPPISVGQESTAEYMELYFTQKVNIDDVKNKISAVLPEGFKLISAKRVPLKFPAIDILSNVAEYSIRNTNITQDEIDVFLSAENIIVEKVKKGKTTLIDAKPVIRSFKNENGILKLFLRFGSGKTVKPEMILKKLLENNENYVKIYQIERVNLYIEMKDGEIYAP
ncbi:MAG: TIGR03936 family radical SAM-associated protein, partial [Endomicrobia bacterium]|nr:TIGR03936 family radical SAM-associated protein [Endomicrobiia bacterium]